MRSYTTWGTINLWILFLVQGTRYQPNLCCSAQARGARYWIYQYKLHHLSPNFSYHKVNWPQKYVYSPSPQSSFLPDVRFPLSSTLRFLNSSKEPNLKINPDMNRCHKGQICTPHSNWWRTREPTHPYWGLLFYDPWTYNYLNAFFIKLTPFFNFFCYCYEVVIHYNCLARQKHF